jgi:hypothetical protein
MGLADNRVQRLRHFANDAGQRAKDRFQPLAAAQQAERHDHLAVRPAQLAPHLLPFAGNGNRCAVRDKAYFLLRNRERLRQKAHRLAVHHDDPFAPLGDLFLNGSIRFLRVLEHRVEGRHDRLADAFQKRERVIAGFPSENAEFVLQRHDCDVAAVDFIRRLDVSGLRVFGQRPQRGIRRGCVVPFVRDDQHRIDAPPAFGGANALPQMVRIGREAASFRDIRA